jgi:hypothetical protein
MRATAPSILVLALAACGNATDTTSLAGRWLITGPAGSGPQDMATLDWSDSSFSFSYADTTVMMSRMADALTVHWTEQGGNQAVVQATHSGGVHVGALPFNPTGDWIFTSANPSDHPRCMASFTSDTLTNSCSGVSDLPALGLYPFDGTVTAHRTQTGASIFGDLGGTWNVSIGTAGQCVVTLAGSMFQATCTNAGLLTGGATATITGDIASGTIGGWEFSAQRQ